MSELTVFNFEANNVRVVDQNGEPWFVLRDVLKAMGTTTRPAIAKDDIEQGLGDGVYKDYPILDSMGRTQQATIISEHAVTFLISRSNTETGRKLNRWIHTEVLPSIRKTGAYSSIKDPNLAAIANTLIELDMVKQQQAKLAEQQKQQEERLNQIETAHNHFTIVGYCSLTKRSLTLSAAARIGKLATRMCDERGFEVGSVPDPRFGTVNTYPKIVLQELFEDF